MTKEVAIRLFQGAVRSVKQRNPNIKQYEICAAAEATLERRHGVEMTMDIMDFVLEYPDEDNGK